MSRIALSAVLVAVLNTALIAQDPKPTFEIASVRPQTREFSFANMATGHPRARPGGAFTGTHATVASLIMFAYNLTDHQVSGGPEWVRQSYFDINARAKSPETSVERIRPMVQSLLEDRFGLVAHTEQREMRYVALVLARRDGQLGPFLLPVDGECDREKSAELRKKFSARPAIATGGALGDARNFRSWRTCSVRH